MNILLTDAGIEGKDEFIMSPEPNCYFIVLRVTPEQSAAFDGTGRIGICLRVNHDGSAGVTAVRGVGADNVPSDYAAPTDPASEDSHFTAEQIQVLDETEERAFAALSAWFPQVKDDLDEHYDALSNPLEDALRQLLGQ